MKDATMDADREGPELGAMVSRSGVSGFSGARLRRYRHSHDLTIDSLADAAGVSSEAISAWETGRSAPTAPLLARVANILRITVADLAPIPEDRLRLSDLRVQAGLNQGEAAAAVGISATLLGRIEKGRKPYDVDRAAQLAELYGTKLSRVRDAWNRDIEGRELQSTYVRNRR